MTGWQEDEMNSKGWAQEQVDNLRKSTVEVIQQLVTKGEDLEFPAAPEGLLRAKVKLADNRYRILVVGEAKRGKSTFVNALIGKEILPKDVDIATSQVFYVSAGARESYRVRYENDGVKEITQEDLSRYGSQVYEDLHQAPEAKNTIRWIEVDVPVQFLPASVAVLDTPGVGGLYSEHQEITGRFVPEADGVIFVLDPKQPVLQREIAFIDAILKYTQHILFVMTKADAFTENVWQAMIERDQQILTDKFGDRLKDVRIWPISSQNLLAAAGMKDNEELLAVSGYKGLMSALLIFLFRASGWGRTALAAVAAQQYQQTGAQVLQSRRAALAEADQQKQLELHQQQKERTVQFDAEWGPNGKKYQDLVASIRSAIVIGKRGFSQEISPNGNLAKELEDQIKACDSVRAANELGQYISSRVASAASESWRSTCDITGQRCLDLVEPFMQECMALMPAPPRGVVMERMDDAPVIKKEIVEGLRTGAGYGLVTIAVLHLVTLAVPIVAVVAIAAFLKGHQKWRESQLMAAQGKLRQYLQSCLQHVRNQYLEVNVEQGKFSVVDEYFERLERSMLDQVRKLAQQKSDEARAELVRLEELAKADKARRQQEMEKVSTHLTAWGGLGKKLGEITSQLERMLPGQGIATATGR
jgi:GTPase SAR1 family protein